MRLNRCFLRHQIGGVSAGRTGSGRGLIASVEDPVRRYLTELRSSPVGNLTIAHLLEMRSGIRFTEGVLPWNDAPPTYYATDLRPRLLRRNYTDPVGSFFHYNDWHPLLISLILERATGKTVTDWLQEQLWTPLGAEHAASMMVDRNDPAGVEHLESGLTATAIDLAKFGLLFLQDGVWNGRRLLPEGWVKSDDRPRRRPELIRNGSPIIVSVRGDNFSAADNLLPSHRGGETGWTEAATISSRWASSGSTSTSVRRTRQSL